MEEEITKILKRAHKIKKVFVPKELRKKYNLKVRMLFNDLIDKPGLLLKCKRHNISTFTIAEELQLVKRYLQGESTLDLSKDGLSHSAIANTINKYANTRIRSKSFSLMHLKKYEIRKKQYHLQSNYAKYLLKNKIIEFGEQESGVALISAFILTDGYVSKSKSKKRLVLGFSNTNKELVQAFTDLIFMTFGEVPSCIKLNIKQKSSRYVAPWHNHLIKKVLNFCFDKNNKTAKKILKIKNHKLLRECLRIAYSCDGFISFYVAIEKYGYSTKYYSRLRPNLAIGCKPKKLREEWKKIMQKCELKSKLEKDRVKVSSWKSLRKFNEFGGFLPNTFIGGDSIYFRGQDKNVIIQKLLYLKDNNLQNHKCDFKDFSYLKNRIIKFGEINENTKYNSGT